jgi:hypothetical protein
LAVRRRFIAPESQRHGALDGALISQTRNGLSEGAFEHPIGNIEEEGRGPSNELIVEFAEGSKI